MSRDNRILTLTLETQKRIGRLALRDHGLHLKTISLESGIPYSSVIAYFSQANDVRLTEIPITVFVKLIGVIPDYLLSQLLAPADRHIAENGCDDGDHDTLAENCISFASKHARARHPQSPEGVEIAPCEDSDLTAARRQLKARA